jgi:hypothetical protein
MAALSSKLILCKKLNNKTACSVPEKWARTGLNNVALTIIGKGEVFQSDAFRSGDPVACDAQSSNLA